MRWPGVRLAALLLLGACAGLPEPVPPEPAPPRLGAAEMVMPDGARLPLRRWMPVGEPRMVVVALHGINDYSHAFEGLGAFLAQRGVATYAYDQRGFGGAPMRNFWPGEEALVEDFAVAVRLVRAAHPGGRLVCLGESMGGAVVMVGVAGKAFAARPDCDAVVLSAPAVWGSQTIPAVARGALAVASAVAPSYVVTGQGLKVRPSDNIAMLRELSRDPYVLKGTRLDVVAGLVDLMSDAYEAAAGIRMPVLWLYGARDVIVPRKATERAMARLPPAGGDVRRIAWYANGYHMLFRDLEGAAVATDTASWILDPARPLPSGADAVAERVLARLKAEGEER